MTRSLRTAAFAGLTAALVLFVIAPRAPLAQSDEKPDLRALLQMLPPLPPAEAYRPTCAKDNILCAAWARYRAHRPFPVQEVAADTLPDGRSDPGALGALTDIVHGSMGRAGPNHIR